MAVSSQRGLAYLCLPVASGLVYHSDQYLLQEGQGTCEGGEGVRALVVVTQIILASGGTGYVCVCGCVGGGVV